MHQVEHREAPVGFGGILRREIDIAGALRAGQCGIILLDPDFPVRHLLLQIIVHPGLGDLDAAGPEERAEELPAVGVRDALAVHRQGIIVETGHEGFRRGFPDTVLPLGHLIGLAAHIDRNGLRLGEIVAENGAQIGVDLGIFRSGNIRGGGGRFGEDAHLPVAGAGNEHGGCEDQRKGEMGSHNGVLVLFTNICVFTEKHKASGIRTTTRTPEIAEGRRYLPFSPKTHQRTKGMRCRISYRSGERVKTATVRMTYIATGGSWVYSFII